MTLLLFINVDTFFYNKFMNFIYEEIKPFL